MRFCKDFEVFQFLETSWKDFASILAGCCDLSQLASTGVLAQREWVFGIQNLHTLLAPLLVQLGWERSKVQITNLPLIYC